MFRKRRDMAQETDNATRNIELANQPEIGCGTRNEEEEKI